MGRSLVPAAVYQERFRAGIPTNSSNSVSAVNSRLSWNGRLEEEGTKGGASEEPMRTKKTVHLYSTPRTVWNWPGLSRVTVVYIWDPSFSIATVGAIPCIGHLVGTFVEAGAIGGEYSVDDIILPEGLGRLVGNHGRHLEPWASDLQDGGVLLCA